MEDEQVVSQRQRADEVPVLEARGMSKRYQAVQALQDASIAIRPAEVMGLVGDNGAGKSTLVKTISGFVTPDSGELTVDGTPVTIDGPAAALELGIETVYQDLALVDPMSVLQNIFLGREPLRPGLPARLLGVIDRREMRREATRVLDLLGARIPSLDEDVRNLSGGQRQSAAIARALLWGRKLVILDEPTAALGVRESKQTLEVIARLRDQGVAVLVITHNLAHLMEIADRVTVLRLGRTVAVRDIADTEAQEIVGLITGAITDHAWA